MSSKTTLRRAFQGFVVAVAATASLAGCAEIEVPLAEPYEPAHLESTGPDQPARVILTEEAQHRVQLQTTLVKPHGADVSLDHAALVYDKKGKPWVFTVIGPRTYVRAAVGIKEVQREQPGDPELWPAGRHRSGNRWRDRALGDRTRNRR